MYSSTGFLGFFFKNMAAVNLVMMSDKIYMHKKSVRAPVYL